MTRLSEIKRYLLTEQGYTVEQLNNMPLEELVDLYQMYNED